MVDRLYRLFIVFTIAAVFLILLYVAYFACTIIRYVRDTRMANSTSEDDAIEMQPISRFQNNTSVEAGMD